ncbi:MAG: hypothetical protein ACRDJ3_03190 [Solirubrobacteraceae bacterium]
MATRAIVTSHPVVACDVCGRRLLRGEHPDVFLAGGHRRTVCELCVPRAAAEGWLREADNHAVSVRPGRSRRTGSLLGRLRQLREPGQSPLRREGLPHAARPGSATQPDVAEEGLYDFLGGGSIEHVEDDGHKLYIGSVEAGEPDSGWVEGSERAGHDRSAPDVDLLTDIHKGGSARAVTSGDLKVERALEVFNAGDPPRRVAGVSRSLGAPSVTVRPLEESGSTVAIVVAWELCWYRYEVDLGDEAAGPLLVAQGLELDELPEEDRLANASADERGELVALPA